MKRIMSNKFKVMLSLILATAMLLLPMDALAVGNAQVATADEAELSATGASLFSGDGSPQSPYLIQSSDDWDALSDHINSGGTDYSGKYFMLTDDISVSTVLGNRPDSSSDSNDNVFCGTFDGGGHKLTVNLSGSDFGAAPFAFAHNATIKNLRVDGTINSTAYHASGLVAASKGKSVNDESSLTIQNVTVSVDVSCTSHIAGVIGHAHAANITMENVVFDGSLNASNIQGGMIGWGGLGNGARFNATFKDCLFAGTYRSGAAFYPIAYANGQGTTTLVNDFYTTSFGSGGSPIAPTGAGQLKLLAAQVEKDGSVKSFDNIATASNSANWTEGSTLKLMTDVTTSSTITVPSGEHTLDLNGHGIRMTGSGSVITVNNGATLNLDDSAPTTEHKFTVANAKSNGAGLATVNDTLTGEYKTFTGGYITGGNATNGGGIKVNGTADLTMNGGTIIGNQSSFMGAGIKADNNGDDANVNITVNGGAVIYNTVNGYGAGICSDGAVRINGGTIAYNVASNNPGGIHCHYLHISGGRVENNFAGATDYAAGAHADHEVFISGSPVINDNLVNGAPSNLDWDRTEYRHGHKLILTDALTEDAKISVTMRVDGKGEFTNGWKANMGSADPAKYFTSDDSNYVVILNNNGEAEIGVPPVASVISEETTTSYSAISDAVNAWTAGSTLKLMTDVSNDRTITVSAGKHILDLNGHTLLELSDIGKFLVGNGASSIADLTIIDSVGTGVIKHETSRPGSLIWVKEESSLTLNGGTLEANSSASPVIDFFLQKNSSFTMNGGKIIGTANNGAVRFGANCTFTMTGGEISGLQTSTGIFDYSAGSGCSIHISGNPVVKNNTSNGTTTNFNLPSGRVLTIDGELTDGASIGITAQSGPAEFTNGWKDNMGNADPSKYFTSDDSNYAVILNNNGEAEIAPPPVASVISGDTTTNYSTISDAVSAWTADSTLKLLADVTTNSTITVPSGEHTLDLNGYELKAASTGYSVVTVGSGAELTIDDTSENVGKITGGSVGQNYGGGVTVDGGTLTLKGGAISGNANTHGGIGNCGGGVHVRNGGKFYMEGGEISGNTSYVGGGVCSDTSATTVSITGGVIKNNKTDRFGSAIWAGRSGSAVFRIGGDVQIIDNISTWTADKDGEASVNFVGELLLSGDPTVHGDWKTSGTSAPNSHINLDNDGSGVQRLTLEGALTNDTGAPSITMSPIYRWNDLKNGKTFVFTKNWNQYMGTAHPADYFKLDDSLSGVTVIRKDGEAAFTGSGDLGDLYITFDANGGEGEMDPQLATVTNVTLNENTFTRKGYSFAGWNTEKDGSGTAYDDKANITLSGDQTLYAQWKEYVASVISGETTTDYGYLSDAVNAWTAGSTLKLLADVTTDSTVTVPSGEHTLDLNGHGIKMTGSGSVINIGGSSHLIVNDSNTEVEHKFTVSNEKANGAGLATVNDGLTSGYKTFTGGYITGGNAQSGGGIVVQTNGKLTLNGGVIIGNQSSFMGGGIKINGDSTFHEDRFIMNGGAVKYNYVSGWGAGICSDDSVKMTGGTVSYNCATNNPGGIHCHYLYISGGRVENNFAGATDYAAGAHADHEVFISGSPVITDNLVNGVASNLDWDRTEYKHGHKLNLTGALTGDAKISVTMRVDGKGEFTNGWKDNMGSADPAKYFISDNSEYSVAAVDGEVWLCKELTGVTAEGYEGDYDGNAHGITVSVPDGVTIKYGTTEGSYTLTDNPTYTDAGTYTVYYEASKLGYIPVNGSAQIKITPIDVTVTITGHTLKVGYDGNAHSADGYDATASSTLYDVTKNITYSGRAEAVRTNVGTTQMGFTADKFSNTNDNFAKVTFHVTDGSVTIDAVDAEITTAPHAKDQLVYNESFQTLVEPGSVTGGTLYYALGSDERIAPSDAKYSTNIPIAKNVGSYYIWYKVIADSNHIDLAPACVKVTLAEEGWTTVSGRIYDDDNNPVSDAVVTLTLGGKAVDQIISGSDGGYYFTAPPGVYNIVVKYDGATVTDMVDIDQSTTYDIGIFDANTDSLLNVVGNDNNIVVGGLNKEAKSVRDQEMISSDKNVTVRMTVTPVSATDKDAAASIESYAADRNLTYYDFTVEKTVDSLTSILSETQNVLEIVIPCSFVNKKELAVYRSDGSGVLMLTESDSGAAGTYRVDASAGLVYIYTDQIMTYAIGYKPYYSIRSDVSLGGYSGAVSVTLSKDGDTIYELNDVSSDSISFRGVPKGTYSLTVTWIDGAENSLTTPFEIK